MVDFAIEEMADIHLNKVPSPLQPFDWWRYVEMLSFESCAASS